MLRNLLTPIRARFDLSPQSLPTSPHSGNPDNNEDSALEDFARDVMVELMRNAVDSLKTADDAKSKAEALAEIQRILVQDPRTKDVFRELDGFLALMSALSTVHEQHGVSTPSPVIVAIEGPGEQVLVDVVESTRLVFMILSEAMFKHPDNMEYFRTRVGFEFLAHATLSLISDSVTTTQTLGLLLSLAVHDFTFSSFFVRLRNHYRAQSTPDPLNTALTEYQTSLNSATIRCHGALLVLWNAIASLSTDDGPMLRCALFKILELLSHVSHRNHALLCSLSLVGPVFTRFLGEYSRREGVDTPGEEKNLLQKLLRRLLEMGAETSEARRMFQSSLMMDVDAGESLDMEVLDLLRVGMKSRWTEHFSLEGTSSLMLREESMRGLPSGGFTFMMWMWISELPTSSPYTLFSAKLDTLSLVELKLNEDGSLNIATSSSPCPARVCHTRMYKSRWTHVTLVHYPQKGISSTIRLFIDGALCDTLQWSYPKPEHVVCPGSYIIGEDSEDAQLSWCLASACLLSVPLMDELPRFIHHLGPRYSGTFQDPSLYKFLTYEASTSLNLFLSNLATSGKKPESHNRAAKILKSEPSLVRAITEGLGISESNIVFAVSAKHIARLDRADSISPGGGRIIVQTVPLMAPAEHDGESRQFQALGDVILVKAKCMDQALWKFGGPVITLKLVQAANTPHELSRALGVLLDGLKNNWQNSEDMERLRGYDILASVLRAKAQLINLTGFETIFEFLGINFRCPDQSTIINVIAYRAIALDFDLWSHTRKEIQQAHLEHFTTLLTNTRYKKFNMKQRLAKLDLVKRLLFVLQTEWYQGDAIPWVVDALKAVCQADFSRDNTIKPMVAYLAANFHESSTPTPSPQSAFTRTNIKDPHARAEQVLIMFISILSIPKYHAKFATCLPLARICLLLLGEKSTPVIAEQILKLLRVSITLSSSFIRKFELVSGWSVLRVVLPECWDMKVHYACFNVLTRRGGGSVSPAAEEIQCTHIVPAMLAALQTGLVAVAERCYLEYDPKADQDDWAAELTMEALVEGLMSLHTSSPTFRQIFASQQTTQLFVTTYKSFVSSLTCASGVNNQLTIRLLEKLTHLGLALALDNAVAGTFKREILDSLESAETILNPSGGKSHIDRGLVIDNRSVRQRIASAKYSLQVGERMVTKAMMRMAEWRRAIRESEQKRWRKNVQDLREFRRQVPRLQDWTQFMTSERGLWPKQTPRAWRLDETEGPHRIRKKLEPIDDSTSNTRVDMKKSNGTREVRFTEGDMTPEQVEVPPWEDSYEVSTIDIEERQLAEEIVEDKLRRVRHELEPGDVIEAVQTVARVAGVDSSPGLLIIGKTHVYMLDGLVENDEGEVIDAHDAPKRLFFVPGSIVELDGPQRAQRWSHSQIAGFSDKRFLFRDVALELYFKDSRSLLIVFLDQKRRAEIDRRITAIIARHSPEQLVNAGVLKSPLFGKVGQAVLSGFKADELATAQRKWQAREISNFTYLSILNQISGRTPSDATQYPIFPWVLRDYFSQTLDLTLPETYRDLTKPMGTLTRERQEAAEMRYSSLKSVNEEPFHYGTHFSSSMIVCHFLIRMAPYTNMFKTLQGGDWDLPDRLFSDLGRAYLSAAEDIRGDVRELIPEFFTCPEFLENSANLDFGVQSSTGERIHDVKLPPWAREDPLLFITLNRRALESPLVSDSLPQWIDLIWGCRQRDPHSFNVFHPLSYEGSIDLDNIQDELEREATVGIIHNFGQTPHKLFSSPHPPRYNHGLSSLPIGTLHGIEEDPHLLSQAPRCFKDLGQDVPVTDFALDSFGDKLVPCPPNTLYVPLHPHERIEWGIGTSELRLFVDHKLVQVVESAFCTCATFADPTNLVTGCDDYTVRLWKVTRGQHNNQTRVGVTHIMRIHTDEVVCVTSSRAWSVVVSGSRDGSTAFWDLNRGVYIRSIRHGDAGEANTVRLAAINESTGYIATCSQSKLCLHTINARHITTLDLSCPPVYSTVSAPITSLAFHERDYSHLGILATGGADGSITLRTWTADGTPEGETAQWEFVTVRTMKVRMGRGGGGNGGRMAAVTAVRFMGESLIHGEETGKSFVWSLPE